MIQPEGPSGVRLTARLDEPLSRWRWLVKWCLVIPHLIVLVGLWIAFAALTIVAGASIALTGRYPRGVFDFNVGVMRWTWRVDYYAFTLGTDQYPPFSLQPDPEYPAGLDIAYPQQLSRRLVWLKWWLLAIPHYLIVAVFTGGFAPHLAGGLIGLLGLVAGLFLALTRNYPSSVFDFLMGLQRWCWRVVAYAALMRDEYPPFRLDPGGEEPVATLPMGPDASPVQESTP